VRGHLAALALACAIAPVQTVQAQEAQDIAGALSAMQQRDQTLLDIGWKLASANARYCDSTVPEIGLMVIDTGSFRDPPAIAAALGVSGNILVQAAAHGSPAQAAGLASPMLITAIDGEPTAVPAAARPYGWEHLAATNERIAASLARDGVVELRVEHEGGNSSAARTALLEGAPACEMRMEQRDGEDRARADGKRVLIGSNFAGFSYPQEELAAAIAHEMAHVVLGHSAWLDEAGRKRGNIRLTEREADRLAPWLLANAGYDPFAMERFMRRWGPDHSGGLLRKRTHAGWDERATSIAAEAALVARIHSEAGAADWKAQFRREVAP